MSGIIRIACVGSRDIDKFQQDLCVQLGEYIISQEWYISSGNAAGSDKNFAKGGNNINPKNVIIYLPWPNYNKEFLHKDNRVLNQPMLGWYFLAEKYHDHWPYLKSGAKAMGARNYGIVYRANKVIALPNPKTGGTKHSIKIAEGLGIPCLDITNKTFEEVVEFLNK